VNELERLVDERIRESGPLPFDEVMELALYHPHLGFYSAGGAGRRADFLTSPEVGPLFGAVVARFLDARWELAHRPDPFVVVDAGAGRGSLAQAVEAAGARCAVALHYVLVDRSATQRERHPERNVSLADLPDPPVHVVIANELLDNLPVRLVERTASGWTEIRVGSADDELIEHSVPADPELAARAEELTSADGRIPIQAAAAAWLRAALALGGDVVVFDYCSATTAALAERPMTEWLRTYRHHQRGGPALEHLGTQDITCEVALDQLARVREAVENRVQADWLRDNGIEELVEEGRRIWTERAAIGDLAAVRARSRIKEAEALMDPAGLGAFRVLEWTSPGYGAARE
jgi:SAM-dependent MidA family methyltransferase